MIFSIYTYFPLILKALFVITSLWIDWVQSLVVSDLRSETEGFQFESGCNCVRGWALCGGRPAGAWVSVGPVEVVMWSWGGAPSPFACSTMIRECSWKKTQLERETKDFNGATIAYGIFEADSSFRVEWCAAGRVSFLFLGNILLVLAGLSFWLGEWALAYHFMEFGQFPDVS